jgi:excisionase family DNA binding protein
MPAANGAIHLADIPDAPQAEPPLLLTSAQLASLLSVSLRTVKRLTAEQAIPGAVRLSRCLRFDRREIEKWISKGCQTPRIWRQHAEKSSGRPR